MSLVTYRYVPQPAALEKTPLSFFRYNQDNMAEGGLPEGWLMVKMEEEGAETIIISPSGEEYNSRFEGLQAMIADGEGQKVLRIMRRSMVDHEGWQEDALLPEDWMFKVTKTGDRGLWSSEVVYLAKYGTLMGSMVAVKEYLENSPKYNFEDINNFSAFMRQDGTSAEDILQQIRDSVQIAPHGLKKYISNQNPETATKQRAAKSKTISKEELFTNTSNKKTRQKSVKNKIEEWSDDEEESLPSDDNLLDDEYDDEFIKNLMKNLAKTEKGESVKVDIDVDFNTKVAYNTKVDYKTKVNGKPKVDYRPLIEEMRPTWAAKTSRDGFNMRRLGRRPFVEIVPEEKQVFDEVKEENIWVSEIPNLTAIDDRKRKFDIYFANISETIKDLDRKRFRQGRNVG